MGCVPLLLDDADARIVHQELTNASRSIAVSDPARSERCQQLADRIERRTLLSTGPHPRRAARVAGVEVAL